MSTWARAAEWMKRSLWQAACSRNGQGDLPDAHNPAANGGASKHQESGHGRKAQAHDCPSAETHSDRSRQAGVESRQNPAGALSKNHKAHKDHKGVKGSRCLSRKGFVFLVVDRGRYRTVFQYIAKQ